MMNDYQLGAMAYGIGGVVMFFAFVARGMYKEKEEFDAALAMTFWPVVLVFIVVAVFDMATNWLWDKAFRRARDRRRRP
jgi:hypothetical protein